jgi:hypothetical protein
VIDPQQAVASLLEGQRSLDTANSVSCFCLHIIPHASINARMTQCKQTELNDNQPTQKMNAELWGGVAP